MTGLNLPAVFDPHLGTMAIPPGSQPPPWWYFDLMAKLDSQQEGGGSNTGPVLDDGIARYLDNMRVKGLRPDTIRTRRSALASITKDLLKPILECTPSELSGWQIRTLERDQWTRHCYARELRAFLEYCRSQGLCNNEMREAVQPVRAPVGKPRPAPLDEVIEAINRAQPRIQAWLALAAFAGLRAGEIARLRAEDVNVRQMHIEVRDGKAGRDRTVLIGDQLVQLMRPFMRPKGRLWQVRPIRVSQLVSAHFRDIDMAWTCHSLRHSYGTELYRVSQDIRLVQEQLGHASPTTTAIYTKPNSESSRKAVAEWDEGLNRRRRPHVTKQLAAGPENSTHMPA